MDLHPVLPYPKKNIGISGEGFKNGVANLTRKNHPNPKLTPNPPKICLYFKFLQWKVFDFKICFLEFCNYIL